MANMFYKQVSLTCSVALLSGLSACSTLQESQSPTKSSVSPNAELLSPPVRVTRSRNVTPPQIYRATPETSTAKTVAEVDLTRNQVISDVKGVTKDNLPVPVMQKPETAPAKAPVPVPVPM